MTRSKRKLALAFGVNFAAVSALVTTAPSVHLNSSYYSLPSNTSLAAATQTSGYRIITTNGTVYAHGSSRLFGDAHALSLAKPIVGSASTADGLGYWLVASDGGIFSYGDAQFYGSTGAIKLNQPIVGITATTSGAGYYLLAADGGIFNFGDAPFLGSQGGSPLPAPAVSINSTVATVATASGSVGFDVSNYQCGYSSSPSVGSFDIIEASGWPFAAPNPCILKEASWTNNNYEMYMFMALPIDSNGNWQSGTPTSEYQSGPQAATTISNQAYNYGWNAAQYAYGVASGQGASSTIWWIDVEGTGTYWSNFPSLNTAAIQGAVDFYNSKGLLAGLYSGHATMYASITTGTSSGAGATITNSGGSPVPLWFYSSYGSSACTNLYNSDGSRNPFAGGVPWYIQTYPNNSIDIDYAC